MTRHLRSAAPLLRLYAILAALVALALVVFTPGGVFAEGLDDPTSPIHTNDTLASIHLSAMVVSLIVGFVLPILVAILTRWDSKVKGLLLTVLSAVTALIANGTLGDGTAIVSQQSLVIFLGTLASGIAGFIAIWKPARLTSSVSIVKAGDATDPNRVAVVRGKFASGGIL
jgi:hypothetical protein